MAETFITKQARPGAASTVDLYTVPAATRTLVSSLLIANDDTATATYRVTHALAGAADAVGQRIAPDVSIPANSFDGMTIGGTLNATDVIRVRSSTGNVNFFLYGIEKT